YDGWQWAPDLIWVNNLEVVGTPGYYVQKLFSLNKGTAVVPVSRDGKIIDGRDSLYATAVIDEKTKEIIVKIVNALPDAQNITLNFTGVKKLASTAEHTLLQSEDLSRVNTIQSPRA